MKIAVVDDEKIIREQIRNLSLWQDSGSRIDTYAAAEDFLRAGKAYEIVFLDIQLEGISGMEAARALRKRDEDAVVIFVTASREYLLEAFDVAAFHYLLKPVEQEKFARVFQRASREVKRRSRTGEGEVILVRTRERSVAVHTQEILYVESRGKKVELHTMKEMLEFYSSMNELERQLGSGFFRCHRGYLVNMSCIAEYDSESIQLSNGKMVYMSREKYKDFVKAYMKFLKGGSRDGVCHGNVLH